MAARPKTPVTLTLPRPKSAGWGAGSVVTVATTLDGAEAAAAISASSRVRARTPPSAVGARPSGSGGSPPRSSASGGHLPASVPSTWHCQRVSDSVRGLWREALLIDTGDASAAGGRPRSGAAAASGGGGLTFANFAALYVVVEAMEPGTRDPKASESAAAADWRAAMAGRGAACMTQRQFNAAWLALAHRHLKGAAGGGAGGAVDADEAVSFGVLSEPLPPTMEAAVRLTERVAKATVLAAGQQHRLEMTGAWYTSRRQQLAPSALTNPPPSPGTHLSGLDGVDPPPPTSEWPGGELEGARRISGTIDPTAPGLLPRPAPHSAAASVVSSQISVSMAGAAHTLPSSGE